MANPTSSVAFNNIITTTIATASSTTGYSYRPRTALKPPTPYPVSSSPRRHRSKKPNPRNRISKPTTPSPKMTTEQKAHQCAKMTPRVPKPRAKTSAIRNPRSSEPAQVLTFTEERVKTVANDGGWVAKGYRWYTSLVGFSVFTPDIQERVS